MIFQAVISRLLWDSKVSFLACYPFSPAVNHSCHFLAVIWSHFSASYGPIIEIFPLKIVVQYLLPFAILVQNEFLSSVSKLFPEKSWLPCLSHFQSVTAFLLAAKESWLPNNSHSQSVAAFSQLLRESWLPFLSHYLRDVVHPPAFYQLPWDPWQPFLSRSESAAIFSQFLCCNLLDTIQSSWEHRCFFQLLRESNPLFPENVRLFLRLPCIEDQGYTLQPCSSTVRLIARISQLQWDLQLSFLRFREKEGFFISYSPCRVGICLSSVKSAILI